MPSKGCYTHGSDGSVHTNVDAQGQQWLPYHPPVERVALDGEGLYGIGVKSGNALRFPDQDHIVCLLHARGGTSRGRGSATLIAQLLCVVRDGEARDEVCSTYLGRSAKRCMVHSLRKCCSLSTWISVLVHFWRGTVWVNVTVSRII